MAIQVIDSGNLDAIVKDATGEGLTQPVVEKEVEVAKTVDPEDIEDEDGLTPREKRELTVKMQKAIGKRVRQAREAEEFAADEFRARRLAEQRAEQLQAELDKATPAKVEEVKTKPERAQFATDGEFITATVNYEVEQALEKKAAADAKIAEESRQAQIMAEASARIAKAIELVPDFVEVTESADIEIPRSVAGYMQESDMFAELGYFLAKNQEVVVALHKMTPMKQLVEIGKIESKLVPFAPDAKSKDGATPSAKSTNGTQPVQAQPRETDGTFAPSAARRAAPVITPISANGAGSVEQSLESMDVRDHISAYAKKHGTNLLKRQRH